VVSDVARGVLPALLKQAAGFVRVLNDVRQRVAVDDSTAGVRRRLTLAQNVMSAIRTSTGKSSSE
jgi:hypothetical protein